MILGLVCAFFTINDRASTIYPVIYHAVANPVVRGLLDNREKSEGYLVLQFVPPFRPEFLVSRGEFGSPTPRCTIIVIIVKVILKCIFTILLK